MTVEQMRAEITKVYPTSDTWSRKVDRMYDDQVIAIYYKFLKEGRFNTVEKKFRIEKNKKPAFKQLNMFDMLKEANCGRAR